MTNAHTHASETEIVASVVHMRNLDELRLSCASCHHTYVFLASITRKLRAEIATSLICQVLTFSSKSSKYFSLSLCSIVQFRHACLALLRQQVSNFYQEFKDSKHYVRVLTRDQKCALVQILHVMNTCGQ